MIGLIITMIIILVIMGLLLWAASLLTGVGIPQQVVIAIQICIILAVVLILLYRVGLLSGHL